jgi:signal transduction histidine kinase/sensor domain CHASE-containing protein/CheY-like chemotaxis protein
VTLRLKTLVIIGATLLGLLVAFALLSRFTLLSRFAVFENDQVRNHVERASTALENELDQLSTIARDDAQWDAAYNFVVHKDRKFLEENFPSSAYATMRLHLIEYLNASGQVIFRGLPESDISGAHIPSNIQEKLARSGFLGQAVAPGVTTGILLLSDGPMMVASAPILKSSGEGPPRGTLIMGRRLDANEIHRLGLLTRMDLQIYRLDDPRLPADARAVQSQLSRLTPIASRPESEDFIRGYQLISDVEARPALLLSVRLPRTIYREGKLTEIYVIAWACVLGIVFSGVMMYLLEREVLSRLVGLGDSVAAIGNRGDLSVRVAAAGKDELSQLAGLINRMLADLERAEREGQRERERYRAYIAHSTEGIWRCELREPLPIHSPATEQVAHLRENLYFAECNDALAKLHGFASAEEMQGRTVRELFDMAQPENLSLAHHFLNGGYKVVDGESLDVDASGHTRYFLNNISGVVENGCLIRVWGTQREVTEQRRLEAQLRQAQKMEAVGRLAGGVAHDFNNLLSVIHGYTEILTRRFRPGTPEHREAEQVLHATDRAASLTLQLLAFGRKQVLAPKILDLNRVVQETDSILRRLIREDIEVVIRTAPDLWVVRADPAQMEQVIMNLAVNASDATPSGGRVVLETSNVKFDENISHQDPSLQPGRYVVLSVSDTGTGMDAETRAHIFEPFFTTKEVGKGTGLGLATVYGIVQQSGGYISVYSEPGLGSVFKVYLPPAEGKTEPAAQTPVLELPPKGAGTVLLVEDDAAVRKLAQAVLEERGYTVLVASDGMEALAMVDGQPGRIDLLVTDVIMPGMAGDELVEHMRLRRPDLKVVFVSGYASESIPKIVTNAKTSFLQKPFPVQDLIRKVYEMIAGS